MTITPDVQMTINEALELVGIDAHDHDMRVRFHECFVCGGPVNFMRLYTERKRYCERHDEAPGELGQAIRLLNLD